MIVMTTRWTGATMEEVYLFGQRISDYRDSLAIVTEELQNATIERLSVV